MTSASARRQPLPDTTVLRLVDAAGRYGRARVRWSVDAGHWQRPYGRVVVTHNGPLTSEERLRVAVLAGPPGTVLAGLTAAALGGLTGFDTDDVHVAIAHRARSFDIPGVVVHRSTALDGSVRVGDPPRTRMERSVIDGAAWARVPRLAQAIVLASVQQRLTTPTRLLDAIATRGNLARLTLVRESVLDSLGGLESLPEREFALLLRRAGLPRPTTQAPVRCHGGRYRLDALFEPSGVAVEIDGAHHRDVRQSRSDLRRQNELVVAGRPLLRFSSYEVRHEPQVVADVVRRALFERAG